MPCVATVVEEKKSLLHKGNDNKTNIIEAANQLFTTKGDNQISNISPEQVT